MTKKRAQKATKKIQRTGCRLLAEAAPVSVVFYSRNTQIVMNESGQWKHSANNNCAAGENNRRTQRMRLGATVFASFSVRMVYMYLSSEMVLYSMCTFVGWIGRSGRRRIYIVHNCGRARELCMYEMTVD